MATTRHHLNASDALRRVPTLLVMVLTGLSIASLHAAGTGPGWPRYEPDDDTGRDTGAATFRAQDPLAIEGAFERESYAPGSTATLRFFTTLGATCVRIFHVGPELMPTIGDREMRGVAVTGSHRLPRISKGGSISIRVGDWESGLYFAELTGPHGRIGYAPFIVRPHRLGEHRIAVVLPTRTWQAYNFRDDDGDGRGDTWYANWNVHRAALARPFLDRGVPPHFRRYDLPFLHWLAETGKRVDVLSQADLEHADGRTVSRSHSSHADHPCDGAGPGRSDRAANPSDPQWIALRTG